MTRLAQHLAANYPNIGKPGDSTDDKAIAALREMDQALGLNSITIQRLTDHLRLARIYVQLQTQVTENAKAARADLEMIDTLLAEVSS